MFKKIKNIIGKNLVNVPGWNTNRNIVVFESDDWGSIRMPSRKVYNKMIRRGYLVNGCIYSANDTIESNNDIKFMMDVLSSVKDSNGYPAIFTINNIVGNPDFEKIKKSGFKEYYYEPFTDTLNKQNNSDQVMRLYRTGIKEKLFKPQFHGREHIHTDHWIQALCDRDVKLREVFEYGMFTYYKGQGSNCKKEFLDAFGTYNKKQLASLDLKLKEGLDLFEKIWGYRSKTIIAPCYIWSRNSERSFYKYGIKLIQSSQCQKEPLINKRKYNFIRRFTGQKNSYGQVYSIRNVTFEPVSDPNIDWVDKTLKEISTSFFWKKPAIISTHRVNFVGGINTSNRDQNLFLLKELLNRIIKKWPNVEFLSSDQLAELILGN